MDNIIRSLIDLDTTSQLMLMKLVVREAIDDGVINKREEETTVKVWMAELNLLDSIKQSIEAQELLNEDQKDYLWSIVLEGV